MDVSKRNTNKLIKEYQVRAEIKYIIIEQRLKEIDKWIEGFNKFKG